MAENIVQGLFGMNPYQVQQQQYAGLNAGANKFSQLDPFERASQMGYNAGGMLAGAAAPSLGGVNVEQEQAQRQQAVMQGADTSTPEGLMAIAKRFNDAGMPQQAAMAVQGARQMQAEHTKLAQEQAKTDLASRKQDFQETEAFALKKMQAEALIRQNDERIADARTSTADRNALLRDNKEIKRMLVGGSGSKPANNLLQKDQRWVNKDGDWQAEIIPGSRTYVAQKDKYASDKNAVDVLDNSFKNTKDKISFILDEKNKSAFGNLFGGYAEKFGTQYMSGKTADIKQKIESLKSEMKSSGLQIMRSGGGVGQVTEREWGIMEKMIDSLDPTMSEENARKVIEEIGQKMESVSIQGKNKFESEWSGSQFHKGQATQETHDTMPNPKQYVGKTMTDTNTGIKYKSNGTGWVRQ